MWSNLPEQFLLGAVPFLLVGLILVGAWVLLVRGRASTTIRIVVIVGLLVVSPGLLIAFELGSIIADYIIHTPPGARSSYKPLRLSQYAGPIDAKVRYRLDVTFSVNGTPFTGSAVQEVAAVRPFGADGQPAPGLSAQAVETLRSKRETYSVAGQALVLPLPNRPTLLVLMSEGGPGLYYDFLKRACGFQIGTDSLAEVVAYLSDHFKSPCSLKWEALPDVAGIKTPSDGSSLRSVERRNELELEPVFGAGVRFVSAAVTPTTEPLTTGIQSLMTWLPAPNARGIMFDVTTPPDATGKVHIMGYMSAQFARDVPS